MRETSANGHEVVFMPKDVYSSVNKLATISWGVSRRQWETAAIVAMICQRGKPGRPAKNAGTGRANSADRISIRELASKGIFGLRSQDSIRAYLRAWDISGLPAPEAGQRIELPIDDFPDVPTLYGRDKDAEPLDAPEDADDQEDAEDDSDVEDVPSRGGNSRERSASKESTMLDQFLKVLDRADPAHVIHGQDAEHISLLIKTLESWLDSLREAAGDSAD
jgi:hypothetical protein